MVNNLWALTLLHLYLLLFMAFIGIATPNEAISKPGGRVIVFHAGSLSVPLMEIEKAFEKTYPDIDVLRESGGSTKMARMITEVGKPADVYISADYSIIDSLLIPAHAEWNIMFATNQIVLCYTPKSRFSSKINQDNWPDILLKKGVSWGHADPDLDPCGYRSLMVMQLAESYYKRPGLYEALLSKRSPRNIRPKSVELISLLDTGALDYAWEYLSVAVQHDLQYIRLPVEINLGDEAHNHLYEKAQVKVMGKRPGTFMVKRGRACVYGATILKNARNKEAAMAFMAFLLDPQKGLKILSGLGQPPIIPCQTSRESMLKILPKRLKVFCAAHGK